MRKGVAHRLNRMLIGQDQHGNLTPPGAGPQQRWVQEDAQELVVVSRGDGIDFYVGRRVTAYNFTLTPSVAVRFAWWLLRWWVFTMWFGFKLRLWNWSLGVLLDAKKESR